MTCAFHRGNSEIGDAHVGSAARLEQFFKRFLQFDELQQAARWYSNDHFLNKKQSCECHELDGSLGPTAKVMNNPSPSPVRPTFGGSSCGAVEGKVFVGCEGQGRNRVAETFSAFSSAHTHAQPHKRVSHHLTCPCVRLVAIKQVADP